MGLFARLVVIALGTMSVVSLVITAERLLFFRKSRADSIRYARATEQMFAQGRLYEAAQLAAGATGGYLGRVMEAGLRAFTRSHGASREYVLETVGRALERQAQREVQTMKRGHGVVATISSTAPFVGLLGTVLGIVTSFQSMASSGSGGLGTVSGGIAEALVTTAIGLLVAIPAVFAFNWMQSWVDARAVDLSESSNELLDAVGRAIGVAKGDSTEAPKYAQEHEVVTQSGVVSNPASSLSASATSVPPSEVKKTGSR
jgi:biopolymer transport protein ExbB/biopolymer transport protein TolQ